jgi:hypothetical protein
VHVAPATKSLCIYDGIPPSFLLSIPRNPHAEPLQPRGVRVPQGSLFVRYSLEGLFVLYLGIYVFNYVRGRRQNTSFATTWSVLWQGLAAYEYSPSSSFSLHFPIPHPHPQTHIHTHTLSLSLSIYLSIYLSISLSLST